MNVSAEGLLVHVPKNHEIKEPAYLYVTQRRCITDLADNTYGFLSKFLILLTCWKIEYTSV